MKDEEIIDHILAGGAKMEHCIKYVYQQHFKYVYTMMKRHGLSKTDALDAYSDAVTQFQQQIKKRQFEGKAKCSTYLYSILNYKCIDIIRKKPTNEIYESELPMHLKDSGKEIIEILTVKVNYQHVVDLMGKLGSKCKEILIDWVNGYNMDEIAERNDLANAHTARSKKYACFKQLTEMIAKHKMTVT